MDNLDRAPETTEGRIGEHRALLDLARAGKAEALRDAWIEHLDSSEVALQIALERQPGNEVAARA